MMKSERSQTAAHASKAPSQTAQSGSTADSIEDLDLTALLVFHQHGADQHALASGHLPALIYPYREEARIRSEFPVVIPEAGSSAPVMTLAAIFDQLQSAEGDDDEAKRRCRDYQRLETVIRELAQNQSVPLGELWKSAEKELVSRLKLEGERRETLSQNLESGLKALPFSGTVHPGSLETLSKLLSSSMLTAWSGSHESFAKSLDEAIYGLTNWLASLFERSAGSRTAEHLEASLGMDGLDAEALANLLPAPAKQSADEKRRAERIKTALETLSAWRPLYAGGGETPEIPSALSIVFGGVESDLATAVEQGRYLVSRFVDFCRAQRIARLELEDGYREPVHGPYFEGFGVSDLATEEWRRCPAVLVALCAEKLDAGQRSLLVDLLGSRLPLKVVLSVSGTDLMRNDVSVGGARWGSQLAGMVAQLGTAYVAQNVLSQPTACCNCFSAGVTFTGPALFSVCTGQQGVSLSVSATMASAAALESRAFPAFSFDPSLGRTWRERFQIHGPATDDDWSQSTFTWTGDDSQIENHELSFTFADFASLDPDSAREFMLIPDTVGNEAAIEVASYLALDDVSRENRLPYILMVDSARNLRRVAVTRAIVAASERCLSNWRALRELGGIQNSHVLHALDTEVQRLEDEKQAQVSEIEQRYAARLEADLEQLSREIVQRIAAGLLNQGLSLQNRTVAPTVRAQPDAEAPASASVEEVAEPDEPEEESGGFDDPYIDTPLCTTCNECTNLNDRLFAYNQNKQAYIKDPDAGTYRELVVAAELCPVDIIHPGKPRNSDEPGIEAFLERAKPYC